MLQSPVKSNSRAPRNRTIELDDVEVATYSNDLLRIDDHVEISDVVDRVVNQDVFETLRYLPTSFADLLFIDPPYNLNKSFNSTSFAKRSDKEYAEWFDSWFDQVLKVLKPDGSAYICADWRTSATILPIVSKHLQIRNRITWEREKGRGAKSNWKNASEDILFCTSSHRYTFNIDAVKIKRRVLAPYTRANGEPKDWDREDAGNFRLTHPSNLWTDITVPFWSMPENTDHPAQKPEKLLAKVILASTTPNQLVFDPFLGSGTSAVVAKKLNRRFIGVEIDPTYCALALKRLDMAEADKTIQGYSDGVFWERNTANTVVNDRSLKRSVPGDAQASFPSV